MNKKIKFSILMVVLVFLVATFGLSAADTTKKVSVFLGDKELVFTSDSGAPTLINGRTMLPLSVISKSMGYGVIWSPKDKKITVSGADIKVELQIASKMAIINGNSLTMDVTPVVLDGRTYVPVKFIAENLGSNVDWNLDASGLNVFITEPSIDAKEPVTGQKPPVNSNKEAEIAGANAEDFTYRARNVNYVMGLLDSSKIKQPYFDEYAGSFTFVPKKDSSELPVSTLFVFESSNSQTTADVIFRLSNFKPYEKMLKFNQEESNWEGPDEMYAEVVNVFDFYLPSGGEALAKLLEEMYKEGRHSELIGVELNKILGVEKSVIIITKQMSPTSSPNYTVEIRNNK